MNQPTARQIEIFKWIRGRVFAFSPPSLNDIAQQFGMKHPSSARDAVLAMEKKKMLRRETGKGRHFQILEMADL